MESRSKADSLGSWISNSTGEPIAPPTVTYQRQNLFDGTVTVGLTGVDITVDIGHLSFDTGLVTPASPDFVSWSNPLNWDSPVVGATYVQNIFDQLKDGSFFSAGTQSGTSNVLLTSLDDLIHGGPTETEIHSPFSLSIYPALSFTLGTRVQFNVHIDNGQNVTLDQDSTLDSLTTLNGSAVKISAGRTLTLLKPSTNLGTIFGPGTVNFQGSFANNGSFQWSAGSIFTTGVNNGAFGNFAIQANSAPGDHGPSIATPAHGFYQGAGMTNAGTVAQSGTGVLSVMLDSVINNQAGALWDLQSDTGFAAFYSPFGNVGAQSIFNNAGTFRKSGGVGTSTVGYLTFNNTGTVEVNGGTLSLGSGVGGSSANGTFVLSNGGQVIASSFSWSGVNTITGNGTLHASGSAKAGSAAEFNVAGGAILVVDGLSNELGGSIRLNTTDASMVQLSDGGSLSGDVTNTGNFQWSAGLIGRGIFTSGAGVINTSQSFAIQADRATGAHGSNPSAPTHGFSRGAMMTNAGTVAQGGTGVLSVMPDVVINNQAGGLWDLQSDTGFEFYGDPFGTGGGPSVFNNSGTFRKSGGIGASSVGPLVFNNTGTVEVSSGTLNLGGAGGGSSVNGSFVFGNDGQAITSNFSWSGVNAITGNGTLHVGGGTKAGNVADFNVAGGAKVVIDGLSAELGSSIRLNASGISSVQLNGGSLGGDITNSGNFLWTAGGIGGAGLINTSRSFTIQANSATGAHDSNPSAPTHGFYKGASMTNAGTITQGGAGVLSVMTGAVINNQAGGLWDLQSDSGFAPFYDPFGNGGSQPVFNNAGTFRKSGGGGTSSVGPFAFTNTGIVEVDSGTLALSAGGISSGQFILNNGGRIKISESQFNLVGANSVAGHGILEFSPNSANNTGTLTTSLQTTLFFNGGFSNAGKIKLGGPMIVDYSGTSPLPAVRDQILSGYHGGDWSGTGIASATQADASKAIGYGEASAILNLSGDQTAQWQGQTVDATSILVRYTIAGDANLNGAVDFADLVKVAQNYGLTGGATWTTGDFNYDGNTDFADLVVLAQNYGEALPPDAIPGAAIDFNHDATVAFAAVPEPGLGVAVLAIAGVAAGRRRRHSHAGIFG